MPHAPGTGVADRAAGGSADTAPDDVVARARALLATPGLVVITGAPGSGRSAALRDLATAFRGPVFTGGGLAMLQDVPALALSRAVRVRLPAHDAALLAEAVRSRVRGGLLVVDDLQWADPATVAAVAALAAHTRVAVALRTPHRLPAEAVAGLRAAAAGWLTLPPLDAAAAADLARKVAPALGDAAVAEVVRRAGGIPLAVQALARHAAAGRPAPAAGRAAPASGRAAVAAGRAVPASGGPAQGSGGSAPDDGGPAPASGRVAPALGGSAGDDGDPVPALGGSAPDDGDPALASGGAAPDNGDPAPASGRSVPALGRSAPDDGDPDATGALPVAAPTPEVDQVAYAIAEALADLTRPARTAMAALGLLGRPAHPTMLGTGVDELREAGLVVALDVQAADLVGPASPYVAEVAAGMLDPAARAALHRRLAALTPDREAARHLAAAGDDAAAAARALAAADRAATVGERAELLLLACDLPGARPADATRIAAAAAALAAGRPRDAVRVLAAPGAPLGVDAAVLRAEALLQVGDLVGARAAAAPVPDDAPPPVRAGRDRVLLLARLATDRAGALGDAARHGDAPEHAGLRAAVAAVRAAARVPGWEFGLASAAEAAAAAGDPLATRWSAWLLVETLAADGRLREAAATADRAAAACAADLAYSWQARFLAAALWCVALRGDPGGTPADDVVRRAADLTDRTVPRLARAYAVAAASLVEADGGLLAPARARLAAAAPVPGAAALLGWVAREAAWLDGQPERAAEPSDDTAPPLVDGLRRITARWAAYDGGTAENGDRDPADLDATDGASAGLPAVRETLAAWSGTGGFDQAAAAWHDLVVREEVRCLLAAGLHEPDPERAVAALLAAESLAESAGLVVLLGRARRALRRHAVRRETRGPRAGSDLTERERDVLRLVAQGEPSRRIAGQLGISAETVETHIRAGMRKLGARTRTAAAALALEQLR
ncbi:helix-turn-helix transcriptional regulator [Asanoa siamensis]|uniref:HTH luxR-type domain-containing protein n=1 Tax=Asanoa siamensis TaxID=926357 RepID=A0ABQ4CXY2_9ACTN|nr:helix-turn-helix transcriptional regulator [Asanoa siamensis]GIF76130.1 hypothetical protein Asi02nite_56480 [Asanoa siamensis]